ncbi:MAG: hypothetical protein U1E65_07465 [Myxococcota bacterium]
MRRCLLPLLLVFAACGGPSEDLTTMHVGLSTAAMDCTVPGLQAKMQISGQPECLLDITGGQEAAGVCQRVKTGSQVTFRLVYYVSLDGDPTPVELATAVLYQDLTKISGPKLTLDFSTVNLEASYDDDSDNMTNLAEVCAGRNPRFAGG